MKLKEAFSFRPADSLTQQLGAGLIHPFFQVITINECQLILTFLGILGIADFSEFVVYDDFADFWLIFADFC